MKIAVICSSRTHPVFPRLSSWAESQSPLHEVRLVEQIADLGEGKGDLLFLVSCAEVVPEVVRKRYRKTLVVHASDLPQGRGWSPMVWQILEGNNKVTVTLLEAEDALDSGAIWQKTQIQFEGHELCDEIHTALFNAELALMDFAIENLDTIHPIPQTGDASYYQRRTPDDSRLDINRSIAEQFDVLRVADTDRYPAFFDYLGHRYQILLKKADQHDQ